MRRGGKDTEPGDRSYGRRLRIGFVALALVGSSMAVAPVTATAEELGVGMAQVQLDPSQPLYFYGLPDILQYPPQSAPVDSVTFDAGPHHIGIATAPPWFAPEHQKLDYDLLFLRVVRLSRFGAEVIVNASDPRPRSFPRTMWVSRDNVVFRHWSDFLLEVFAIGALDPDSNPVRSRPADSAAAVGSSQEKRWLVRSVVGSWVEVEDVDGTEAHTVRGWLRWRQDDELLVEYWLLS